MAFTEDLDLFLADFGVSVTSGGVSGIGILDMPSEIVADGVVLTTDYKVTCKASVFGDFTYGATMTVDGTDYTVREVMKIDDGRFVEIMLSKIAPGDTVPGVQPRQWSLNDLADVDLVNAAQGDLLINDGTSWVNTPNVDGGGA
jgi:hypothetical protein